MSFNRFWIIACVLLIGGAGAAVNAADVTFSSEEIEMNIIGHTWSGIHRGYNLKETYNRDGTLKALSGKSYHSKGQWKISGDKLCITYPRDDWSLLNGCGQIKGASADSPTLTFSRGTDTWPVTRGD